MEDYYSTSTEIVFFDLETTVPKKPGQGFNVLEFGAIVVCPWKLVELESYTTLIRPKDLSVVSVRSGRKDGITRDAVAHAPLLEEVGDKIFNMLNNRIWAGHNIQRFDCVRIKEAFAQINRDPPQPVGIIDSLGVLTQKFGRRAGNMKMESLAAYFGLGQQKHRSLDDVRMNLEVVKHCATVLFLNRIPEREGHAPEFFQAIKESSLPRVLEGKWQPSSSSTVITRSRSNHGKLLGRSSPEYSARKSPPPITSMSSSSGSHQRALPYSRATLGKMTERVKNLLCKAQQGSQPIANLLKHSHSLLR